MAGGDFRCNLVNIWFGERRAWWLFGWIFPWMFQCSQEGIPKGGLSVLMFGIEFLPPLLWRPLIAQGPRNNHEDFSQFRFRQISVFLRGEKADGFSWGGEKLVLPVEVVP